MKTIPRILLISLAVFLVSVRTLCQWEWQSPLPQGNTLNNSQFISGAIGWAVGEYGTIIRTTDGGTTWVSQEFGNTDNLLSISMASPLQGWVVGDNGTILHTTNGGDDWIEQVSGVTTGLNTVVFWDTLNGWAAGDNETFLHTTNGGLTWATQFSSHNQTSVNALTFLSPLDGWGVGGTGKVYKTTDGGSVWTRTTPGSSTEIWQDITFSGSALGLIVGSHGSILRSTDSGATWSTLTPFDTVGYNQVIMQNTSVGWIVGDGGRLLRTINGGSSWSTAPVISGYNYNSFSVSSVRQWVVGELGVILLSTNSGVSWTSLDSGSRLSVNWIDFASDSAGFAVGQGGLIVSTTNGGSTWMQATSPLPIVSYYGLKSTDATHAWAIGDNGRIIRTQDGTTWATQTSPTTQPLFGITFGDASNGWIVGGEFSGFTGTVLHSSDGGNSWGVQRTGLPAVLYGADFLSALSGWAVGAFGTILHTTDGGNTWNSQRSGGAALYWCSFADQNNGWAVGDSGKVFHTTNGGSSWILQNSGVSASLYSVTALNGLEVFAVGDLGTAIHTNDGGAHWDIQYSRTENSFYSITHTASDVHLCGDYGTIEQYIIPLVTGSISGIVFYDENQNGIRDNGEIGLSGWKIVLSGLQGSTTYSGTGGTFKFDKLLYGSYNVQEVPQPLWTQTLPASPAGYTVELKTDTPDVSVLFGDRADNPVRYDLTSGWNLVSLPLIVGDSSVSTLFPSAASRAFYYAGRYSESSVLNSNKGCWLRFPSSGTVLIAGTPVMSDTIPVNQGWNLIGTIDSHFPVTGIVSNPPGMITSRVFRYNGSQYLSSDTLIPGGGYWVKTNQPGYFVLGAAGPLQSALIKMLDPDNSPPLPPGEEYDRTKSLPREFALDQNFPNPFNPVTVLRYQLPVDSRVLLMIYTLTGQVAATLVDDIESAGVYQVHWDGHSYASGVYYCHFTATPLAGNRGKVSQTMKMLLMK